MNFKHLATFRAVAHHLNFTRAAEQLHLAQSSVSDQIQALEDDLGAALFVRGRQGLSLTPAGDALVGYAEEMLSLAGQARAAVAASLGDAPQDVTLGCLETIARSRLPAWLAGLQDKSPRLRVRLRVAGSGELIRQVLAGEIDAALCFDRGMLDPRLGQRTIAREPMALIASQSGRPGAESPSLAALSTADFIATETGCIYRHLFDEAFASAGLIPPQPVTEAGSIATIAQLVAVGSAMALVPRIAVEEALDRREIRELPWPGPINEARLAVVWRRRRVQPPRLKAILAAIGAPPPFRSAGGRLPHAQPIPS